MIPYHFIRHGGGKFRSTPNQECFVHLKSEGKEKCLVIPQVPERTFCRLNRLMEWAESIGIHKVFMEFSLLQETSLLPS